MWLTSVEGAILSGFSMARMSPASAVGHKYIILLVLVWINVVEQFSVPAYLGSYTVQMYTGVVRVHLSRLHAIDLSEIVNFSCTLLCFVYCNTLLEAICKKISREHNYQNLLWFHHRYYLWFHAQYAMTHVHVSTSSYSRSRACDSRNTKSGRIRVQSAGSGLHGVWISLSPHLQRPRPHLHSPVC